MPPPKTHISPHHPATTLLSPRLALPLLPLVCTYLLTGDATIKSQPYWGNADWELADRGRLPSPMMPYLKISQVTEETGPSALEDRDSIMTATQV